MSVGTTSATPIPWETVESYTSDDVIGQQIRGHHNVQLGSVHGSVVNITMSEQRLAPRLRDTVNRAPRPFPGLVGRETEVDAGLRALADGIPVNVHAEAGYGKSALIEHLAHHPNAPDLGRVVHCPAQRRPLADLLQFLFDAFYDSDTSFVPSFGQLSGYLHDVSGFVLFDDVELDRDDVRTLLNIATSCIFVLASQEPCIWEEEGDIALSGLPAEAAAELVERRLRRPLSAGERDDVLRLSRAVGGHPLQLVQAAAVVRKGQRSLGEVTAEATAPTAPPGPEAVAAEVARSLDERQQAVLAVLAVLTDAPVHVDHIAALTGVPEALGVLQALREDAVVKAHSPSFSLTAPLAPSLDAAIDKAAWATKAAHYFASLAERHRRNPDRLAGDADAVLAALQLATYHGRAEDVVRLGRAAEPVLALARRPGAWDRTVRHVLHAARSVGDRSGEAWAHHQLGIQAFCVHDSTQAREHLGRALELRRTMGDPRGATVTRYHLDALDGPPPPPRSDPAPRRPPSPAPPAPPPTEPSVRAPSRVGRLRSPTVLAVLSIAIVAVVVGLATILLGGSPRSDSKRVSFEAGGVTFSAELQPATLRFDSQTVGTTSAARTVTVRNVGKAPLPLTRVSLVGDAASAFAIESDGCGTTTVEPGDRCQVRVVFAPATAGGAGTALAVEASATTLEIPLSGVGVAGAGPTSTPTTTLDPRLVPPTVPTGPTTTNPTNGAIAVPHPGVVGGQPIPSAMPAVIGWGYVPWKTQGVLRSATVTNAGTAPFTVDNESLVGPQGSDFIQKDSCQGQTLGPGETCQVSFYFQPQTVVPTGEYDAMFMLGTDGGMVLELDLRGTSDKPPP